MCWNAVHNFVSRIWRATVVSALPVSHVGNEPSRSQARRADSEAGRVSIAMVAYDSAMLDIARTQWLFGDWASLVSITEERIQQHPDRANLALFAAAGMAQLGRAQEAKILTFQALDWGCNPRLVHQIIISGTYNSLARANTLLGKKTIAIKFFDSAIDAYTPNADRLVKVARATFQINQLGLQEGKNPSLSHL
jgi:hypothetical protein